MKVLKKNAIKAYKAFNSDWTCRGFQYEVGKAYRKTREVILCHRGFHACTQFFDCFHYYPDLPETKIAEVRCWGDVLTDGCDSKICCSNIEIVRELSREALVKQYNLGTDNTGWFNTGNDNSGSRNTGMCNRGDFNTGAYNSGIYNDGDCNSGAHNTGSFNTGNFNSGDHNAGVRNSGHMNTGVVNTGSYNTGCFNTGSHNSGNHNSGSYNSGDNNTGNWNSGDCNTGCFNTRNQSEFCFFDKPTERGQCFTFPYFLFFNLTVWKESVYMTEEEKKLYPDYKTTCGYTKSFGYKEAFRNSFMRAKKKKDWPEQYEQLKALPNFDYEIFEEISGITKKELEDSVKKFKKGKKKCQG